MNAFGQARSVEAQSVTRLRSFLAERCDDGRYVVIDKGPLAPVVQQIAGDLCMEVAGRTWFAELKSEERHTGNIFVEIFSNRCLATRNGHAEYGMTPGWSVTNRADLLLYHFLDKDVLYVIDFYRFKRWFFGIGDADEREGAWRQCSRADGVSMPRYRLAVQKKRSQLNETVGLLVPLADLPRDGEARVLMEVVSLREPEFSW